MNKIDLIIGRTAFFCLLASVITIVFNFLLEMAALGMIEIICLLITQKRKNSFPLKRQV